MSKLTLDILDSLHRAVKSVASAQGVTMKDFFIGAVSEKLEDFVEKQGSLKGQEVSRKNIDKKLQKTTKNKPKSKKTMKKSEKYITEREADQMLKPYLLRMIKRIDSGEEETYSKEEFFKKLREEE